MRLKVSTGVVAALLLSACAADNRGADNLKADFAQGEQAYARPSLVKDALDGHRGACCWIKVDKGFDGNHVAPGRVYVTTPVERTLSIYVTATYGYDTYTIDREKLERLHSSLRARCSQPSPDDAQPLVQAYDGTELVECRPGDVLLRDLPR